MAIEHNGQTITEDQLPNVCDRCEVEAPPLTECAACGRHLCPECFGQADKDKKICQFCEMKKWSG